jgi:hypothetical protein
MQEMPRFIERVSELRDARQENAYEFKGEKYYVSYATSQPAVDLEVVRMDEQGARTVPLSLAANTSAGRLVRLLGLDRTYHVPISVRTEVRLL